MSEQSFSVDEALALLPKINSALESGLTFPEACAELQVPLETAQQWIDKFLAVPSMPESLSNSRVVDSVFPIFLSDKNHNNVHQIGTGVLVRIGEEVFAITAAHITDESSSGILHLPTTEGILPINGWFSDCIPYGSATRGNDKLDVSYYRLDESLREKLHDSLSPVGINDLQLSDKLEEGELFTFVGYPWRKTKTKNGKHETERTTYTGHAVSDSKYEKLGYNRFTNILIRMHLRKTYSVRYESHQTAPHPQGISGGAVFCWPRTLQERANNPRIKLAAIGHTYHRNDHVLASSRIIATMMAIVRNNPHLEEYFIEQKEYEMAEDFGEHRRNRIDEANPNNVPIAACGIAWYRPETYDKCLEIFDDADQLHDTYEEWLEAAERTEKQVAAQGMRVVRVDIDPVEFPKWCAAEEFKTIDRHARTHYGNIMAEKATRKKRGK